MANISDASGNVVIERVGKEFLDFLKVAQKDGYYLLVDGDLDYVPDSNGDLTFDFGAGGRWNYENNLRGYLEGEWMNSEEEQRAYNKLMRAIKRKDGLISFEYTDSDTSMDWMGTGEFNVSVCDGEIIFGHDFDERSITLEDFAELHGESKEWALEYIYGDEVADAWAKYKKNGGKKSIEDWHANYEQEV